MLDFIWDIEFDRCQSQLLIALEQFLHVLLAEATINQNMRKTKLGNLNYFLIQWFCVRIFYVIQNDRKWYGIAGFVKPMTGWEDDYVWLSEGFSLRVTPKFKHK